MRHHHHPTTSIHKSHRVQDDGREQAEITQEQSRSLRELSHLLRQQSRALRQRAFLLRHLSQRLCHTDGQAEA